MTRRLLHSEIIGKGKPIVLVHGFLSSSHYFKTLRKQLARGHQVITIDLLGFGDSPKPKEYISYDDQVHAIHETLLHLKIEQPFTLIGHSMGALVSLRYANMYPDEVSSVQLFNPPIFTTTEQAKDAFARTNKGYNMLLHSPRRRVYWSLLKAMPRNIFQKRPEINVADTLRASRHAREGGYQRIILAAELLDDLRQSTLPTLLVVGKYDRLVYQENLNQQRLPENITIKIVETGHHTIAKTPELAEQLIRRSL
ncbi:TPA: alpha/beta hydrolase [Candidatus Saccharibacteria bacterium]|nr:MAG: alpha/beta hydrolase [Candidatus Saccharibacteria bacterium GW2011_GWC2_44_17]OGL33092.1 MAG: hypothetical protein A3E20_02085 [Candidatus Saccharibacteria bacterium RIFCSPHIGHO2_12_FULL_47_16]HBH77316.1 alpha/beta hydrolase [Candidatus Saccharibacteria bacterium]